MRVSRISSNTTLVFENCWQELPRAALSGQIAMTAMNTAGKSQHAAPYDRLEYLLRNRAYAFPTIAWSQRDKLDCHGGGGSRGSPFT